MRKLSYPNVTTYAPYVGSPDHENFDPPGCVRCGLEDYFGANDKPRMAAGALFICPEDDTIFLIKRSEKEKNEPLKWSTVGGGSEFDESELETALREVTEECGSFPETEKMLGFVDYIDGNFHYRTHLFQLNKKQKDKWHPILDINENIDWKWFNKDNLPKEDLHFGVVYLLREFTPEKLKKAQEHQNNLKKLSKIITAIYGVSGDEIANEMYILYPNKKEYIDYFIKRDPTGNNDYLPWAMKALKSRFSKEKIALFLEMLHHVAKHPELDLDVTTDINNYDPNYIDNYIEFLSPLQLIQKEKNLDNLV